MGVGPWVLGVVRVDRGAVGSDVRVSDDDSDGGA